MTSSPLVSPEWLEEHLRDPNVRVLEISALPDSTGYREGHIPGASWVFWKDFCWHESDREFIGPRELADRLGELGVGPDTTLVLYGDPVQYGTYAFWIIRMAGHRDIRLLDGSKTSWIADGRPLSRNVPGRAPASYPAPQPDESMRLGRDQVRDRLGNPKCLLLDVRSPEEYSGERVAPAPNPDHGAERKGRIPGARHLFFRTLLNDDDTFKSPQEVAEVLDLAGIDPGSADEIVCYCRLSHRATLVWFALTYLLGSEGVKIYDGSWTEWGSIVGFPIEK